MATDDQQVLVAGTAPTPALFRVPGNGQIRPKAIFATFDGSGAAAPFLPAVKITSDGGELVGVYPTCASVAAGGSAAVSWFRGLAADCCPTAGAIPGVAIEVLYLDSRTAGVTSTTVLAAGTTYTVSVQGTYSLWNSALNNGTPEANAMFPTTGGVGRASTQVGLDPDSKFAAFNQPGTYPQHTTEFQIDLGSGFAHVEPTGGPFAVPQPGHIYNYALVGQGAVASFRIVDSPQADNYGYLRVVIQSNTGTGGGGSTVPVPTVDQSLARGIGGVFVWEAPPNITETDLSLTDITTANASTAKHGLLRKLDNNATHFLDGTGGWTTPPSSSGITDLTSTGGTITVGTPMGPTTNVDLPATGVVAGTYGDASDVSQITVNAEGIITAAASVSIVGGGVVVGSDGWVDDTSETWTYASFAAGPPAVGTFTVPGDVRAKYTIGSRIKLVQTTTKYFVVSADPTYDGTKTTVTISGGTDYTLANAAIAGNFHSYVTNPQGFPGWFNFDGGVTGFSSTTSLVFRFTLAGRTCFIYALAQGTSNATTKTFVLPLPFTAAAGPVLDIPCQVTNNGTASASYGTIFLTSGSTNAQVFRDPSDLGWSASGTARYRSTGSGFEV